MREGRIAAYARSHRDYDRRAWATAARRLRKRLAETGPLPRKEVETLLGKRFSREIHALVPLVRVPPSGTWERRRADLYGDPEAWLGPPPEGVTREAGLELLVRRYLGGFGPSTRKEVADFAGLQPGEVAPALDRMELRAFRAEDGAELLDLPRLPIADPDTPAPVRFLPVWDATLLVHARRTQILPEEHRSRVFSIRTPHSVNTFLVDGAVAGTWRYEDGRVRTEPFGAPGPRDRASAARGGRAPGRVLRLVTDDSGLAVELLQQLVGGELDRLVAPLGRTVVAGDEAAAVQAAEVAVDERVARLGVLGRALGQPEKPAGVLVPRVRARGRRSAPRPWAGRRPIGCRARTGAPRSAPAPWRPRVR